MITQQEINEAKQDESICDQCGCEMDFTNIPKGGKYKKEKSFFTCPICKTVRKKMTNNELMQTIEK